MHSFLSEYDNVKACFKYKIPFYSIFKPICYINPLKSSGVEVVFWNALKMKNSLPLLDQKTRKLMVEITYRTIDKVNFELLDTMIREAISIDAALHIKNLQK